MVIYLFSLFDCVSQFFVIFDFVCVLAGIVDLICWSSRVILSFHSFLLIVIQDLSCYVFFTSSNKKMFLFTSFCRLFNILREIFRLSRLVSLFSHSAKSDFEHQLLNKAIQNEQSQYKKLKSEVETG